MWFKNIYVFAFTKAFDWQEQDLEKHLNENLFTPCGSTELAHFGWVNALGKHGSSTVHSANNNFLLCARKEEKILPAPVIKDMLDEKVNQHEIEHSRSATKKEKEQFKEDILFQLLPRAFSRVTDTHAYINAAENIIVINTSSRTKAEDFLALLRKSLGTLPVTSPSPERAPDEVMTDWLVEKNLNDPFSLGMEAELHALGDDGAVVRVKNQDLVNDEMKAHLDADKYVVKLALEWDDAISFILCDDMAIKRIKFFDVLQEQNEDINKDDGAARIDADFSLMAGELNRLVNDLFAQFSLKATQYLDVK